MSQLSTGVLEIQQEIKSIRYLPSQSLQAIKEGTQARKREKVVITIIS